MGSHDLDNQKRDGEALFTKIKKMEDQIRQLRTAQQQGGDVISVSYGGPYPDSVVVGGPGIEQFIFGAVADIAETRPVFVDAETSFYEDVVDPAHQILKATNAVSLHWRITVVPDQSLSSLTRRYWRVYIENTDSVTHTLHMRLTLRWVSSAP